MADAKDSVVIDEDDGTTIKTQREMKGGEKEETDDVEEDSSMLNDDVPPPRRASVGWDNEDETATNTATTNAEAKTADAPGGKESKRPGRRRRGSENASRPGGGAPSRNRYFDDEGETTDVAEIPDLEEEEREADITTQVAEAPRNVGRAVQSLKELDRDIKFALPSVVSAGIDLSLLTTCLCPERAVLESDEAWNFDSLLNEVAQEMQVDLDDKEELLKATGA